MTTSSPADLAVAFRSLARRVRNAQNDQTPAGAASVAQREVDSAIAASARLVGSAASAEAVAAAIESRRPSDWTGDELNEIQRQADTAARAIRHLEDLSQRE